LDELFEFIFKIDLPVHDLNAVDSALGYAVYDYNKGLVTLSEIPFQLSEASFRKPDYISSNNTELQILIIDDY
jgi:hypothetical protein